MVKSFTVISAVFQYFYASIHSIDGTRVVVFLGCCLSICMCIHMYVCAWVEALCDWLAVNFW